MNKRVFVKFLFLFILLGCGEDDPLTKESEIPDEILQLISGRGDVEAETIIVNTQGGPIPELLDDELRDILSPFDLNSFLLVNVHQEQTINPHLFLTNEISFDEAKTFDSKSVENLHKVISYFKGENKTVYVLGISFGAFMIQELIAVNGINTADKYLIMVGRLNIDDVIWESFSQGGSGGFENGVTPFVEPQSTGNVVSRNMNKLAAGLGYNRYMEKLSGISDLSKITYVYGKKDEQVGQLTQEEIQFLENKGANVIASEEGHSEAIDNFVIRGFKEAFGI